MSSNQSSDTLPSSIPKLDASGVNWAVFAKHFEKAVRSKRLWGHFSGTATCPIPVGDTATTEEEAAIMKWTDDQATADYLLTQKLPDSAFLKVQHCHTVAERWTAICSEYSRKGLHMQADLRRRYMVSKCPLKGNVREFLDGLLTKREELASIGVVIHDKDLRATIVACLPKALSRFAAQTLASIDLLARIDALNMPSVPGITQSPEPKVIDPSVLISLISEEYDRRKSLASDCGGSSKAKGDGDEALAVQPKNGKSPS